MGWNSSPDLLHLPPCPRQAHSQPPLGRSGFHLDPWAHQGLLGTERREAGVLVALTCCSPSALAGQAGAALWDLVGS